MTDEAKYRVGAPSPSWPSSGHLCQESQERQLESILPCCQRRLHLYPFQAVGEIVFSRLHLQSAIILRESFAHVLLSPTLICNNCVSSALKVGGS